MTTEIIWTKGILSARMEHKADFLWRIDFPFFNWRIEIVLN